MGYILQIIVNKIYINNLNKFVNKLYLLIKIY